MLLTLNQVISQITTLGAAHLQIQSTGVGDFAEWQALERAYPLLWVFHETTSIGDRELVYSIRLVCADRVITGEEGDDTAGMEQEVLSDTLLILLDFLAYFQQQHAQSYKVITSASIDPFTERFNDRVAGNSVLIQIRQPFTWDACQIPQTGATIPPSVDGLTLYDFCDPSVIARLTATQVACLEAEYGVDATVTQNGNAFFTVPAGATYPLVTKLDGVNNLGTFNAGTKTLSFTSAACSPVTFQINAVNKESITSGTTFNLITKLDGSVNSGSYDAPTDTLSFTSASAPVPSVSLAVSDTTPDFGDVITLTATPTNITPTSYIFFTYDGATIQLIIEQAGSVYNWTVNRSGTYDVYVLATDGTNNVYALNEITVVIDPDAAAFLIATGITDPVIVGAIQQLVLNLKSYSLWAKMLAIYPMVGATAAACSKNLKSSSFTGTFNGGWTFANSGVTPNGVNAFMNTGLAPSGNLSQNSAHLSSYIRTTNLGNQVFIGSLDGSGYQIYVLNYGFVAVNSGDIGAISTSGQNGLFLNTRTSATNVVQYRNSTALSTLVAASNGLSTQTIYIGAWNSNGSIFRPSNNEIAFSTIGNGLNATETTNLYNSIQAFQTTLGRQV